MGREQRMPDQLQPACTAPQPSPTGIASYRRNERVSDMTFADWRNLSPDDAAREVHRRVRTRLVPAQQKAAIAQLDSEPELAARFAAAGQAAPIAGIPYFAKDLF